MSDFSSLCSAGGRAPRIHRAPLARQCNAACCSVQRCGGAQVRRREDAPPEGHSMACGTPAMATVAASAAVAAQPAGHRPARPPCRGSSQLPSPRPWRIGRRRGHAAAGAAAAVDRRRRRRRRRAPGAVSTANVHRPTGKICWISSFFGPGIPEKAGSGGLEVHFGRKQRPFD